MNRELINDIIQTEIGYYKFVIEDSRTNVYGEAQNTQDVLYKVPYPIYIY